MKMILKHLRFLLLFTVLWSFTSCKLDKKNSTEESPILRLNRQIAAEPDNPDLYIQRAEYLRRQNKIDEAIQDMGSALSIDSLVPEYYQLLSDLYIDKGDGFNARITLERALSLFPENIDNILKLAKMQLVLRDYKAASTSLQRAKALDPFNAEVEYTRGLFFLDQDKQEAAKKAFQAAVELDDQHVAAWLALGDLGMDMDDPLTRSYFDNALRIDPENIHVLHAKAFYIQQFDSLDQAIRLYQKVYALDSTYIPSIFNRAILYLDLQKIEQAKKLFRRCIEIDDQMIEAYYYLGICLEKQDSLQSALRQYQQILSIDSEYYRAQEAVRDLTNTIRSKKLLE